MMRATIRGAVMQGAMVVLGRFVPAIGDTPNFYAIVGTALAVLTGTMVSRFSPGAPTGQLAIGGAIAGSASSVIGGALAVLSGQWPGFQMLQLLYPAISGGMAGGIGGALGRMMGRAPATR